MNEKWSKGEPVSLQELLRITPLVQEAMQVSEDLNVGLTDLFWLMRKMASDAQEFSGLNESLSLEDLLGLKELELRDELEAFEETEDLFGMEEDEDEEEDAAYTVRVRINGSERFPEVSFKAGIMDKADLSGFFEWMADMVEKLD